MTFSRSGAGLITLIPQRHGHLTSEDWRRRIRRSQQPIPARLRRLSVVLPPPIAAAAAELKPRPPERSSQGQTGGRRSRSASDLLDLHQRFMHAHTHTRARTVTHTHPRLIPPSSARLSLPPPQQQAEGNRPELPRPEHRTAASRARRMRQLQVAALHQRRGTEGRSQTTPPSSSSANVDLEPRKGCRSLRRARGRAPDSAQHLGRRAFQDATLEDGFCPRTPQKHQKDVPHVSRSSFRSETLKDL